MINQLRSYIKNIRRSCRKIKSLGFQTADITVGITLTIIIGSITVIATNDTVLDTITVAHKMNGVRIAKYVEDNLSSLEEQLNFTAPSPTQTQDITLLQLINEGALVIDNLADPSNKTPNVPYHVSESKVVVKNVTGSDNNLKYEFYVELKSIDTTGLSGIDAYGLADWTGTSASFSYLDATDEVNAKTLTDDKVYLPQTSSNG